MATTRDDGSNGATSSRGQLLGDVSFHFGGASAFYDIDQTLTVLSPAPSMTWAMEWEQADGAGAGALAIRTDEAGRGTAEFTVTGARDVVGQACSYDEAAAVAVCDVPVDVHPDSAFRLRVWTITVNGREAIGAWVQPSDGDEVHLGAALPAGSTWLGREMQFGEGPRVIRDTVSYGEDAGCASVRKSAVLWGVPGADGDDRTGRYQYEGRASGQLLGGACVDADAVGDEFYAGPGVAMTVIGS
jgi:hypothetical protein